MKDFVNAYIWLYGGTQQNARRVYRNTGAGYHNAVIECFEENARKAFYND